MLDHDLEDFEDVHWVLQWNLICLETCQSKDSGQKLSKLSYNIKLLQRQGMTGIYENVEPRKSRTQDRGPQQSCSWFIPLKPCARMLCLIGF